MNTWVVGDIHGEVDKLKDAFYLTPTKEGDTIIFLGDYCDRGLHTYEVVDFITELSLNYKVITIKGNHDSEFVYGLEHGVYGLYSQGAKETIQSYLDNCYPNGTLYNRGTHGGGGSDLEMAHLPGSHIKFWKNLLNYHLDEEGNLFVHGGINRHKLLDEQDELIFLWDRDLFASARSYSSMKNNEYSFKIKDERIKHIYIGHTPVQYFGKTNPMTSGPVTLLDLGSGKFKDGKVCFYNITTKEFYTNE